MSNIALEIEGFLQEKNNIFVSGIDGRPTHPDSYMTVIEFVPLFEAIDEIKDKYTREQWLEAANYWIRHNYLSPVQGMLGGIIKRKFDVN